MEKINKINYDELDQLEKFFEQVSNIPWDRDGLIVYSRAYEHIVASAARSDEPESVKINNMAFIAAAPTIILQLIDQVRTLKVENVYLSNQVRELTNINKQVKTD